MTKPWLSVLTPVYNGEDYVAQALDSIALQADPGIECIAVNGESTDGTLAILRRYQDRLPLKILSMGRDSNWIAKTNHALSVATGEYACFLHHDDVWFPNRLKTMRRLTREFPSAVLALHASRFIDPQGKDLGPWTCPLPAYPNVIPQALMLERLLVQNFIAIPTPVFKREVALQVGGLDETLWYTADWDLWLKVAAQGDALYHPRALSGYRVHPSSQTIAGSSNQRDFRGQLDRVTEQHFHRWQVPEPAKRRIRKVADFSNEVNATLANLFHGGKPPLSELGLAFLKLGPAGWHRYFRDSRIHERASSRLRMQRKLKT